MQAGKLRHRVQIQGYTEAQAADGSMVRTWSTNATVWAAIEPLNARELLLAQQLKSEASLRVRIRHIAGMTTRNRLLLDSRVLAIESVLNVDERNRELTLLCREVT